MVSACRQHCICSLYDSLAQIDLTLSIGCPKLRQLRGCTINAVSPEYGVRVVALTNATASLTRWRNK